MTITEIINRRTIASFVMALIGLLFFILFLVNLSSNNFLWILWLVIDVLYAAFVGIIFILYAKWKSDMKKDAAVAYEIAKEKGAEPIPLSADEYHSFLKNGFVITKGGVQVINPKATGIRKVSLNEQANMRIQGGLE